MRPLRSHFFTPPARAPGQEETLAQAPRKKTRSTSFW